MYDSEYTMDNARITIEAHMQDGSKVTLTTQGNVHIKGEDKYRAYSMYDRYDHIPHPSDIEYTLSARLEESNGAVMLMKKEKVTVTRTATAPVDANVRADALAKRLGIPENAKSRVSKDTITFTWEENV